MSAVVNFYGSNGTNLQALASSGAALFGDSGFGASVLVGAWNGHTYVSNSGGTVQGPELWNNKYVSPTSIILGQTGTEIPLNEIPNQQAVISINFTNDTPVRVQNATVAAYDRVNPANMPSGITVALYEVNHTGNSQTPDGSGGPSQPTLGGNHRFWIWDGTNATGSMPLIASPGTSGLSPSGSLTTDTSHSWYLALSNSPNSISSKPYGLFFQCEYL